MLNTITDEYIKKVLSEHQKLLTAIHDRLLELYFEMEDSDGMIKSATFGGVGQNIGGGRSSEKKDLTDIMMRHFSLLRAQSQEIRMEMMRLVEEQETINRIWCCFEALDKEERELLTELYVKGRPYKDVQYEAQKNRDISRTTFERIRKCGIEEIRRMYDSSVSNVDIISNSIRKEREEKKKKQSKAHGRYEQMSLDLFGK